MPRFLMLLLLLAGCSAPPPPPPAPDPSLRKREVVALLESLEKSFYSHWGSLESTAEYQKLRDGDQGILRELADANGDQALMALRVLAKRSPAERFSPDAKAILYWTVFAHDIVYNRWGVISKSGFLPGVYGQELLTLGAAVAPYFQQSLRDQRPVAVFGREEERTSRIQHDRVCDYAWVLLASIFDRPLAYHEDPRLRDPQIHELDVWLDRRKGAKERR
ncbi:MAG TPA: hypothetical protein VE981_15765 [Planctomycetota bacterium]|nr:hypothetical protein [Planctomycetota bacterium]